MPHIRSMAEKHPKRPTDEATKAKALSRWESEGGAPPPKLKRPRDLNQGARQIVDIVAANGADEPDSDADKDRRRSNVDGPAGRRAARRVDFWTVLQPVRG
jgi:hypothetical protein